MDYDSRLTNEVEYIYTWGGIDITEAGTIDSASFTGQLTNNWTYPDTYGRGPNLGIGDTGLVAGPGNVPYHERNIDQSIIDNASNLPLTSAALSLYSAHLPGLGSPLPRVL